METVRAACPKCHTSLKIPPDWFGKNVKCKKCGCVFQVKRKPAEVPPAAESTAPPPAAPVKAAAVLPATPIPATAVPAAPISGTPLPAASPVPANSPFPTPAYPGYSPAMMPGYPYPATPGYAYAPLPGYSHPVAAPPVPGPAVELAAVLPEPEVGVSRRLRRKGPGIGTYLLAGFIALFLVGLVGGTLFWDTLRPKLHAILGGKEKSTASVTTTNPANLPNFIPTTDFPRRMLVLNVTKYLYCNNLTAGDPRLAGDHVTTVASKLAFHWRIPTAPDNNQLFIISDTAKNPRPMLKSIIQESYQRFFDTSRDQDRIVVYFGGHARAIDGKGYLVPVDGDLEDPETLVPLEDFWTKLEKCPAQQKIVLFDVCRLNEDGEKLRPGSEPMTEELQKLLVAAPAGVQVALSCKAGENAWEFRRTKSEEPGLSDVAGSVFLSAMKYVATKGKAKPATDPGPNDPIPLTAWTQAAQTRISDITTLAGQSPQTLVVHGNEPVESTVPADKTAPVAKRFDLPVPPRGLSPRQLAPILGRISLAPIKPTGSFLQEARIEEIVPFTEEVMNAYMPDAVTESQIREEPDKYPARMLALRTLDLIRKEWGPATDSPGGIDPAAAQISGVSEDDGKMTAPVTLRVRFEGDTDDAAKKEIQSEQEKPARIILLLEDLVREMDALVESGELEKEPSKYWQVTFQYAHAQAKARLAFMHEYNLALAYIRTDSLPEKKKGDTGWQMVSVAEMKSKRDIRDIAEQAREMFEEIASKHKGTPWAVLAKRAKSVALGLEWRTYNPGGRVSSEE
jgi:hypothetical protein